MGPDGILQLTKNKREEKKKTYKYLKPNMNGSGKRNITQPYKPYKVKHEKESVSYSKTLGG